VFPARWPRLIALPPAVAVAAAWAGRHERRILRRGQPLSARQRELARQLGVARPEAVRLMVVPVLPLPGLRLLHALGFGRLAARLDVSAMTLGHGIYCIGQPPSFRLLAHELAHVRQVEQAGSLRRFLADYLAQVARFGYWDAPLEVQAREAARGHPMGDRDAADHSVVAGGPFSAR
jgi:hypothetical protein